jgi:hypothetical protein
MKTLFGKHNSIEFLNDGRKKVLFYISVFKDGADIFTEAPSLIYELNIYDDYDVIKDNDNDPDYIRKHFAPFVMQQIESHRDKIEELLTKKLNGQ